MDAVREGQYNATCKERNALAAAVNGHGSMFPQGRCNITSGQAVFYRDGVEVWRCDALHFNLEPVVE